MRFTLLAAGAFAVLANAQTTASPTLSVTPAESSTAACLKECKVGDVNCQSHCIAVPSPDEDQANATTECVGKCPQGDGTAAETEKYSNCINDCIAKNFFVTSTGTPSPTGAAGSGSGSGNDDDSSDDSGSGSDSDSTSGSSSGSNDSTNSDSSPTETSGDSSSDPTSTETDAAATSSDAPGAGSVVVASSFTVFGIFAAILAL